MDVAKDKLEKLRKPPQIHNKGQTCIVMVKFLNVILFRNMWVAVMR